MRITSATIQIAGKILVLLVSLTFVGCAPYATVKLKPYADTETATVEPNHPDIQMALTIINSVLVQNGYTTRPGWINGRNAEKGWWITTMYIHNNPGVDATIYNRGVKQSTDTLKAGKRSVELYVTFQEPMRWFLKVHPDVIRVRNEIAQKLADRFGKEKIVVNDGRMEMPLQ